MVVLRAGGVGADLVIGDAADWALGGGDGKLSDVDGKVGAGVDAVEEVEELDEGKDLPAVAEVDGAGDAEVGLDVRGSAELVEDGGDAVDGDALACCRRW